MKYAGNAQFGSKSAMRLFWRLPRGWILLGAAVIAWFAVAGAVGFCLQLFSLIVAAL